MIKECIKNQPCYVAPYRCIILKNMMGEFEIFDESQKDENGLNMKIAIADSFEGAENYIENLKEWYDVFYDWNVIHEDFA